MAITSAFTSFQSRTCEFHSRCGVALGAKTQLPPSRTIFLPLDRPDTSNPGEATAPPPRRPTFRNIVHERDIAEDFHPHTQPPKTPSGEERVVGENGAQLITTHYRSKLPSEYVKKPNSNGAANAEGSEVRVIMGAHGPHRCGDSHPHPQPSASSTVTASSSAAGKASQVSCFGHHNHIQCEVQINYASPRKPSDDRAKDCQKPISGKNPPSSQDAVRGARSLPHTAACLCRSVSIKAAAAVPERHHTERLSSFAIRKV